MKNLVLSTALLGSALFAANTQAIELQVSISNLTQGMSFTPRLLVAHTSDVDLYQTGVAASTPLAWLAESGSITDASNAASAGENFEWMLETTENAPNNTWQVFGGLLAPATTSAAYTFETNDMPYLSLVSMLIPTNDAFVGMDSIAIPSAPGTYNYYLNAYDAGTELNDEISPATSTATEAGSGDALGGYGVPGMAGVGAPTVSNIGSAATGVAVQIDGSNQIADGTDGPVHIHRNVMGDTDATAGRSDLDATVHRWLNPVARITIIVPAS
ncbi:MAG: hypothetical protein COA42_02310 [Alteromonadaceae bacterium]|nr:MAG: hypothetical protein COA42_02310 [Alteromonadaceae bacterium]